MKEKVLESIPGVVPAVYSFPQGCRYAPRCPWATDECRRVRPERRCVGGEHDVACHHIEGGDR